jgi:hypothetical protein
MFSKNSDPESNSLKALENDIRNTENNILLINIGSCCSGDETHQEFPPFLNKMNKESCAIFNIDSAYKDYPGDNRYAVKVHMHLLDLLQEALDKGKKIIIFDNTSQTGLHATHSFAHKNLSELGNNLEIIIGYGTHGDQAIIPILHPDKHFFEKSKDNSSSEIRELAMNYCNPCQTLYRPWERSKLAKDNYLVSENESLTKESWGNFFISNPKAQAFVKTKAAEKGIEIYFNLDEFENIPLFVNNKNELVESEEISPKF